MPSYVDSSGLTRMAAYLRDVQERTRPGSAVRAAYMRDQRENLLRAHDATLQAGLNADGSAAAPLKPSTLEKRKGSGPPRVPSANSVFLTRREAEWMDQGGTQVLTLRYRGIPWIKAFITGSKRMVARPPGVAPQMMGPIRERHSRLGADILRRGGGR